jgi:hypothetical protein
MSTARFAQDATSILAKMPSRALKGRARSSGPSSLTRARPLPAVLPENRSRRKTLLWRFQWDATLRDLQTLEQQLNYLRRVGAVLRNASVIGDELAALRATEQAQDALATLAITATTVRHQVVPADGLGRTVGSLSELALRAIRTVVLASVCDLNELLYGSRTFSPSNRLLVGRYQKMAPPLQHELERIPAIWMPYREGAPTGNRVLYRTAIRAAQHAMSELSAKPELARFRQLAASRTDWREVQLVSMRLVAALAVRVDSEPDSAVFTSSRPLHIPTSRRDSGRLEVDPAGSHRRAMSHR